MSRFRRFALEVGDVAVSLVVALEEAESPHHKRAKCRVVKAIDVRCDLLPSNFVESCKRDVR